MTDALTSPRLAGEWAPQRRTWLAYPHDPEVWGPDLRPAQAEFMTFCRVLAGAGEVAVLVPDEATGAALRAAVAGRACSTWATAYGDIWLRDTGPLFALAAGGGAAGGEAACFAFNGWGGRYLYPADRDLAGRLARRAGWPARHYPLVLEGGSLEVDGTGLALTTRQCLQNPNRNPGLAAAGLTGWLRAALGIEEVVWLDLGLHNDHTDGHIDTLARFIAPNTVVVMRGEADDPNRAALAAAEQSLRLARLAGGRRLDVRTVPSPGAVVGRDGELMPASYLNFVLANDLVVVPTYGAAADGSAVAALAALFPGRRTVGLPARALLSGGGAFHCMSQHEPQRRAPTAAAA